MSVIADEFATQDVMIMRQVEIITPRQRMSAHECQAPYVIGK